MKDYRTWWRKGYDVERALGDKYLFYYFADEDCMYQITLTTLIDLELDTKDCVREQLWAQREGLSD